MHDQGAQNSRRPRLSRLYQNVPRIFVAGANKRGGLHDCLSFDATLDVLFLNRLLGTGSELPFGERMAVEWQNGVRRQANSLQAVDQLQFAAYPEGQCLARG